MSSHLENRVQTKPAAKRSSSEPCFATAIRKASRRVTQLYDEALVPCGLKSTQFAILSEIAIRGSSPPTMGELAESLVIDRSALGHNLRPLERDKLIALEASDSDRRRRLVVLTAKGRAKYGSAAPLWEAGQERFAAVFGKQAAVALRSTMLGIAHDERLAKLAD